MDAPQKHADADQKPETSLFVGLDPLGANRFGWAILEVAEGEVVRISTDTANTSSGVIELLRKLLPHAPQAVGINAPLFWVSDGDRQVDAAIRSRVLSAGGPKEDVVSVNSQRGASMVQGVIVAQLSRRQWPQALMTETNSKALLRLYAQAGQFLYQQFNDPDRDHDKNAVLSAFSAWQGSIRQLDWRDLSKLDRRVFKPVADDVAYWFPLQ
jgi:Protein of unknown function (DUF429)